MSDIASRIRVRFDHAASKKNLKEKYEAKLVFAWQGGMFKATPEMIGFLCLYGDQNIVVKDLFDVPVKIAANELCELMKERLQEQMNAWYNEYDQLQRQR